MPPPTRSLRDVVPPWHTVSGVGLIADGAVLIVITYAAKQPVLVLV